jgi:hypothetical protein
MKNRRSRRSRIVRILRLLYKSIVSIFKPQKEIDRPQNRVINRVEPPIITESENHHELEPDLSEPLILTEIESHPKHSTSMTVGELLAEIKWQVPTPKVPGMSLNTAKNSHNYDVSRN